MDVAAAVRTELPAILPSCDSQPQPAERRMLDLICRSPARIRRVRAADRGRPANHSFRSAVPVRPDPPWDPPFGRVSLLPVSSLQLLLSRRWLASAGQPRDGALFRPPQREPRYARKRERCSRYSRTRGEKLEKTTLAAKGRAVQWPDTAPRHTRARSSGESRPAPVPGAAVHIRRSLWNTRSVRTANGSRCRVRPTMLRSLSGCRRSWPRSASRAWRSWSWWAWDSSAP